MATRERIDPEGGVFSKSKGDPAALAAWYQKHLEMPLADFGGAILSWPEDRRTPVALEGRRRRPRRSRPVEGRAAPDSVR